MMASYLINRVQSVPINGLNSTIQHIKYGIPYGSILGPLAELVTRASLLKMKRYAKVPVLYSVLDTK